MNMKQVTAAEVRALAARRRADFDEGSATAALYDRIAETLEYWESTATQATHDEYARLAARTKAIVAAYEGARVGALDLFRDGSWCVYNREASPGTTLKPVRIVPEVER